MGSKRKFWFRFRESDGNKWLFKYPRHNTGEHWAEKISEAVATLLNVPHARVELGTFGDTRGSMTKSFLRDDTTLVHGNQLLGWLVQDYDEDQNFHQLGHTIDNIFYTMDSVFSSKKSSMRASVQMGSYLVLDALIGNTDRHHENWGICYRPQGMNWVSSLAPSYDHASSLGRELLDQRRDTLLNNNLIPKYSVRGRGGIFRSTRPTDPLSPLALVRESVARYPEIFRPTLLRLDNLNVESLAQAVYRVPPNWMTDSARRFAVALMCYNLSQLRETVR